MTRLTGKVAPNFNMPMVSGDGQEFSTVSLADYKGQWLVFFFYPLDFTFVCPTELTAMSHYSEEFSKLNTSILGVSTDSVHSHKAWLTTPIEHNGLGNLTYPLASDQLHSVSKDYGVYIEDEGVSLRGLFIIDPEGIIRYQVVHDNNIGRNVEETLRVLQALQSGGLCPINWKPGQKTLNEK